MWNWLVAVFKTALTACTACLSISRVNYWCKMLVALFCPHFNQHASHQVNCFYNRRQTGCQAGSPAGFTHVHKRHIHTHALHHMWSTPAGAPVPGDWSSCQTHTLTELMMNYTDISTQPEVTLLPCATHTTHFAFGPHTDTHSNFCTAKQQTWH